jgi:hypothetical protein
MNGSRKLSLLACMEMFGPALCSVLTFIVLSLCKNTILGLIVDDTISVDSLYNAVFGWAAIQTGCLYAIYGYIAGKTDGFIGEIRESRSMKTYKSYLQRATLIGFILTVTSMPLIVWHHKVTYADSLWFFTVSLWVSIFVWAFVSFVRVAYIFGILINVSEPTRIDG